MAFMKMQWFVKDLRVTPGKSSKMFRKLRKVISTSNVNLDNVSPSHSEASLSRKIKKMRSEVDLHRANEVHRINNNYRLSLALEQIEAFENEFLFLDNEDESISK